jgi:alanine-glyoxylate transaminase/serine-glyoxylate transaminase/serine-pyruvate transaminase
MSENSAGSEAGRARARFAAFVPPERLLLGPGPSPVPASVLAALGRATIGHLDPEFLRVMDEVRAMLRAVFETESEHVYCMSGTGSAGMETVMVNLVEPGTRALVGVCGVFGGRMAEVARRAGADVTEVRGEWGRAITVEAFRTAAQGQRFDLLCAVHAETSTGVLQPLEPLRELADDLGALLVVDAVTSLGGVPVRMDARRLDAVYSGTQKCLSCPPGLSPLALSERAAERLRRRTRPVQSWYLDLSLIAQYWGRERAYHHTAPINMIYGLHEALRLVLDEGDARFERHRRVSAALAAGLEAMGLELLVPKEERLPPLTAVRIPEGVDDGAVRAALLREHGIEIGGGLGPLKGRVWRIGLMGAGATNENVDQVLAALGALVERRAR